MASASPILIHTPAAPGSLLGAGRAYVVDNSCIGTAVGPGKRTTERLVVTPGDNGMRIGTGTCRYCASGDLPASLHHRAVP